MIHKFKKRKFARDALKSRYGVNTCTALKIIGILRLHPQALEKHLSSPRYRDQVRTILASLRIEYKLRLIVFSRILLQAFLKTHRGIRHIQGLPSRGQRTHANGKTSKHRLKKSTLVPFKFKKYITFIAPPKKKRGIVLKNKKKPLSITKQKKLHKLSNIKKKAKIKK